MFEALKNIVRIIGIIATIINLAFLPVFILYEFLFQLLGPVITFLDLLPPVINITLGVAFVLVVAWIIIKILRDFL